MIGGGEAVLQQRQQVDQLGLRRRLSFFPISGRDALQLREEEGEDVVGLEGEGLG